MVQSNVQFSLGVCSILKENAELNIAFLLIVRPSGQKIVTSYDFYPFNLCIERRLWHICNKILQNSKEYKSHSEK